MKEIKGTGKTQKEVQQEKVKKLENSTKSTRTWTTTQGQFGKVYVSGNYRVSKVDSTWFVETPTNQYTTTTKTKAMAMVELLDRRSRK